LETNRLLDEGCEVVDHPKERVPVVVIGPPEIGHVVAMFVTDPPPAWARHPPASEKHPPVILNPFVPVEVDVHEIAVVEA